MLLISEKRRDGGVTVRAETELGSRYEFNFQRSLLSFSRAPYEEAVRLFLKARQEVFVFKQAIKPFNLPSEEVYLDSVDAFLRLNPDTIGGKKTTSNTGCDEHNLMHVFQQHRRLNKKIFNEMAKGKLNNPSELALTLDVDLGDLLNVRHYVNAYGVLDLLNKNELLKNSPFVIHEHEDEGMDIYNERLKSVDALFLIREPARIEKADKAFQVLNSVGTGVLKKIEALPDGPTKTKLLAGFTEIRQDVEEKSQRLKQSAEEREAEAAFEVFKEQIENSI